jgi:hypothetical protein
LCSNQAVSCPKCGHPINPVKPPKPREKFLELKWVRAGLWILLIFAAFQALAIRPLLLDMPYSVSGANDAERTSRFVSVFLRAGFLLFAITLLYVSNANKRK